MSAQYRDPLRLIEWLPLEVPQQLSTNEYQYVHCVSEWTAHASLIRVLNYSLWTIGSYNTPRPSLCPPQFDPYQHIPFLKVQN
jgi:hypothetical protein